MRYQDILHIDDDEDDQEIFVMALAEVSAGISSTAISDAKDAMWKLTKGELAPDVIFLDLNMPVMSGQQFLMELNKNSHLQKIPVIILSTSSHAETIQLTKDLGAHDFITKPGNFDELVQILKSVVG